MECILIVLEYYIINLKIHFEKEDFKRFVK